MDNLKFSDTKEQKRPLSMYEQYIHLDVLLHLQHEEEQQLHPDDLTFQVVHQTFELWWKVTTQFLHRATIQLATRNIYEATKLVHRATAAQTVVMQSLQQLEALTQAAFLTLRPGLGTASGASSPGFHMIKQTIPKIWTAFSQVLEHEHVELLDIYLHPAEYPLLCDCAEALISFDEQMQLFRAAHLKVAKRYLGSQATGTGGSSIPMLERALQEPFFPPLWEVRTLLLDYAEQHPDIIKKK